MRLRLALLILLALSAGSSAHASTPDSVESRTVIPPLELRLVVLCHDLSIGDVGLHGGSREESEESNAGSGKRAGDGTRTRDIQLGKLAFYH